MNTKLKKLNYIAAGLFVAALLLNVKMSLDNPFVYLSKDAIANETTSVQRWEQDLIEEHASCYQCIDGVEKICECIRYTIICDPSTDPLAPTDCTESQDLGGYQNCELSGHGCVGPDPV